jgi:phosphate:Na+ symporter
MKKFLLTLLIGFSILSPTFAQNDIKGTPVPELVSEVPAPQDAPAADTATDSSNKATTTQKEAITEPKAVASAPKGLKKKYIKLDSKIIQKMIFSLLGGLGIFLLGMRYMSDGIQKIAGPSLKKCIKMVTNNRFLACIAGVFLTILVQSSSVTTVMAVGFVNSGIMALNQAIGVILGANIGTTVTGWVIALKIGKWGLPILGIAAFTYLFSKKEKMKFVSMAIMGVGMVFFGLELMKGGFKPMKELQEFERAFTYFDASTYFGVLKCAFVGCILTVIVQSSSATLGITIALATTGVIPFETAAALVLGENIGTTITAFLASIGASTNAKRAAYFHIFFNLVGVFWITLIFHQYMDFITWFMGRFKDITDINVSVLEVVDGKEVLTYPYMTAGIALVHTIFNVTNVLFFLPFTAVAANILNKIVKDKKVMTDKFLTNLDFQMYDSPFAAIEQSSHEIQKMEHKSSLMFTDLKSFIDGSGDTKKLSRNIFRVEDILDKVQTEVTDFLTDVMSQPLSLDESEIAKKQLLLADEYESISDYVMTIVKHFKRLEDNDLDFNEIQKKEILELHDMIVSFYKKIQNPEKNDQAIHSEASVRSEEITAEIRKYRSNHWERLADKRMEPLLSTTFTDVINSYRKIKTLILHVAETRAGIK